MWIDNRGSCVAGDEISVQDQNVVHPRVRPCSRSGGTELRVNYKSRRVLDTFTSGGAWTRDDGIKLVFSG